MNEDKPDIEIDTLGKGCLTGCGAGCASLAVLLALLGIAGVDLAHAAPGSISGWLLIVGFLLGLGTHFLVGYVTALTARRSPNLHVLIVGVVFMVFGLLGILSQAGRFADNPPPVANAWGVISWLLMLPIMLFGARWAIYRRDMEEYHRKMQEYHRKLQDHPHERDAQ